MMLRAFALLLAFLMSILIGCTSQKVDIGGFNFSQSKDSILINKGETKSKFPELGTSEIEFKSQSDLNQEIEIEINFGGLNSYLAPPYPDGKVKIKLSSQQPTIKLPLKVLAMPTTVLTNEFKISFATSTSSVSLSTDQISVNIDSATPMVIITKINNIATTTGVIALNNQFSLTGSCAGNEATIHAYKRISSYPFFSEIAFLDGVGGSVKCVNSEWTAAILDTTSFPSGNQNLFLTSVDSQGRQSDPKDFSITIDKVAPDFSIFALSAPNSAGFYLSATGNSIPKIANFTSTSIGVVTGANFNSVTIDNLVANNALSYKIYVTLNPDGKTSPLVQKTLSSVFSDQATRPTDFSATLPDGDYYMGLEIKDTAGNSTLRAQSLRISSTAPIVSFISTDTASGAALKAGSMINLYLNLNKELDLSIPVTASLPKLNLITGTPGRLADYTSSYNVSSKGVIKFSYTVQAGDDISSLKVASFVTNGSTFQDLYSNSLSNTVFTGVLQGLNNHSGSGVTVALDTTNPSDPLVTRLVPAAARAQSTNLTLQMASVSIGDQALIYSAAGCGAGSLLVTQTISTYPQSVTFNGLSANADFTFYVQMKDAAVNISNCVGPVNYTTDNTGPVAVLSAIDIINSHREIPGITWTSAASDLDHFELAVGSTVLNPTQIVADIQTWTDVGLPNPGTGNSFSTQLNALSLVNGLSYYIGLRAYDTAGNFTETRVATPLFVNLSQHAYVKAFNSKDNNQFASSVDIQTDTMVSGAAYEDSNTNTICNMNGYTSVTNLKTACTNESSTDSGAAYIYKKIGSDWSLESFIKSPLNNAGDNFGFAVSLDNDRVAVGSPFDDSNYNSIFSTAPSANPTSLNSGAVFIFKRVGSTWAFEAMIKPSDNTAGKQFGTSLKMKGNYLIVGAPAGGVNKGSAYIFKRSGSNWTQSGTLRPPDTENTDFFGQTVALASNPVQFSIGAPGESSGGTGSISYTGFSTENSKLNSGAVYVYKEFPANTFSITHILKASNSDPGDKFGSSLAMSDDTIAIGAPFEQSAANTITNGTSSSNDNSVNAAGAVYVFKLANTGNWAQEAYIKSHDEALNDSFGNSISLAGSDLLVGMAASDDQSRVIRNNLSYSAVITCPGSLCNFGAAYLYHRDSASNWSQANYIKAVNGHSETFFGSSVALDSSGNIAISSPEENSISSEISNSSTAADDNSGIARGAVYIYKK